MKKTVFMALALMMSFVSCAKQPKSDAPENSTAKDGTESADFDVPPAFAVYVKGQPLFVPFNEGDLLSKGEQLKSNPGKYTKFIIGGKCFDVNYKEEKNKELEHDDSYLNEYVYQIADQMKGQLYNFANLEAVEQFMLTFGDTTAEGELITQDYNYGIIASADYMKNRSVVNFMATMTEDPEQPQFKPATVAEVEKLVGAKVLKNRISHIFGDEYNFGVMTTQPNDKYGIAAWVLDKDGEITVWTDTCQVEDGQVYWSNYDPDEYNEPGVIAVVKSNDGLDIYCGHADNDETMNYVLMRQKGRKMQKFDLGSFYQRYQ
jgi:hypothetical protein